jgi:hypothetical protein
MKAFKHTRQITLISLGLLFSSIGNAQSVNPNWCGTGPVTQITRDFLKSIDYTQNLTENTINIPVTIHIIRSDQGGGSFTAARAIDGLCDVNNRFSGTGMKFFLAGNPRFIDDSDLLNPVDWSTPIDMLDVYNVPRTVNIYYTNLSAIGLCGFAFYPLTGPGGFQNDGGVVMSFACSQPNGTTLAHELGHYFALPHTFDQTSENPLDPLYAELVTRNTNEILPRRSANCNIAGDFFCDTPADFIDYRWNCPTAATAVDLNGDVLRPDSSYYMSYSSDVCMSRFSEQQVLAMRETVANTNAPRGYLLLNTPGALPDISQLAPTSLVPAEGDSNIAGNFAEFRWTRVAGAQYYNLKVYQFGGLLMDTLIVDTVFVNRSNAIRANRNLSWEVRALNQVSLCTPYSTRNNFRTGNFIGLSASSLELAALQLWPNPIRSGENLTLSGLKEGLNSITVYDLQGRKMAQSSIFVEANTTIYELPSLKGGVYFIETQNEIQLLRQKIVVKD